MDGFRKYADSYRIAEQLRKFADNGCLLSGISCD